MRIDLELEPDLAGNLRRLMARFGLTLDALVAQTGLDERTLKGILNGRNDRPHARTLHKLAAGLGVPADELFQHPSLLAHREFDRATNPVVDEAIAEHPRLFAGWSAADFDELYSRFGEGGGLTLDGTLAVVHSMNQQRDSLDKAALILESSEAELLRQIIETLYERVVVKS
ncbi:MAG: helix-turn-helix domain-containing protein [Pirellulales bacterium]